MARKKPSDFPARPLDVFSEHRHGHIDRRSFLDGVRMLALPGMADSVVCEMMGANYAWAQTEKETHPASAGILERKYLAPREPDQSLMISPRRTKTTGSTILSWVLKSCYVSFAFATCW